MKRVYVVLAILLFLPRVAIWGANRCMGTVSGREYADTDCDGTKDAGEEYLDLAGGSVSDGDKVDITVSNSGADWNIDADAVGAPEIAADGVGEPELKLVNAATDEYVLTHESTTGDFEWEPPNESAWAMTTGANSVSNSATSYGLPSGTAAANATEGVIQLNMSNGFTPSVLACETTTGSPQQGGGTQTYTFTLRSGGSDTDWTCAISETATTCSDTSGSAVAAGLISIGIVPSGTPAARAIRCNFQFSLGL